METADRPSDDSSAPPAAAYPRWILLEYRDEGSDDPDAKTVAHARTSKGHPISVSFVLAAPPASSRLRLHSPHLPVGANISSYAVAAYGDSVLVNIVTRTNSWDNDEVSDYFLYCAGNAAADPSRPPSLSMLPPCYLTEQEEGKPKAKRFIDSDGTAIFHLGQDEVLVAALDSDVKVREKSVLEAELCVLRSNDWQWELKRLPIIYHEGKRQEVCCWWTDRVITVRNRFLLWVDCYRGIIFYDLWHETPELHYVSLPVKPNPKRKTSRDGSSYRSICATNGGCMVMFVEVCPRCCCGCPGQTACEVGCYAFTINTWMLSMDDMATWDKVGLIDCDELWSLPGYHGIVPCIRPKYPTVSLDDPDVLCFRVHKTEYDTGVDGDLGTWLIKLDTRRMVLRSIGYYDDEYYGCPEFVVSAVSRYFDATSSSFSPARHNGNDLEAPDRPQRLNWPKVVPPEEMLATLREIPNLSRDDMLKAYGVLVWDERQLKFRYLLTLPMDMRKDYCLSIRNLPCFDV
ncbi:unnamed protein product [Alopecurus aequalis]